MLRIIVLVSFLLVFPAPILADENTVESIEWTEREIRILRTLSISALPSPPPSLSNAVADSSLAREFGEQLFFDIRLGAPREKSCAMCHQPHNYFTDGADKAGFRTTLRATPTIVGSAYNTWFYADGRRDSLWSQALLPIEAHNEMGSTRVAALNLIRERYLKQYEQLFPTDKNGLRIARVVPVYASPLGNNEQRAAWDNLSPFQQQSINRSFANVGKVLEAYQRTINPQPGRVDEYIDAVVSGNLTADNVLNSKELAGLRLFIDTERTQCLNCHNGALLTNGGFHNIGTGNFDGDKLDLGREFGLPIVLSDPFNCLGNFSDASPDDCYALKFLNRDTHQDNEGSFKVPTLRGLSSTSPYMHDGSMQTLKSVVNYYRRSSPRSGKSTELNPLPLTDDDVDALVAFLAAL